MFLISDAQYFDCVIGAGACVHCGGKFFIGGVNFCACRQLDGTNHKIKIECMGNQEHFLLYR